MFRSMGDPTLPQQQNLDDWMEQLRYVEIYTRKRILAHLFGEYESSVRGTGFEFFEQKRYQRGDDYRRIDWNATARLQHPYVKRFHADKEVNVWLVGDLSSSMSFGSGRRTKSEVMREVVAVLGFSASHLNMKVGFLGFSDQPEVVVTPKQSRRVMWDILGRIPRQGSTRRTTSLEGAVRTLQERIHGTSMIFLVSDFIGLEEVFESPQARYLARRHDFIPVVIEDPAEHALPHVPGLHCVEDCESGRPGMFHFSRRNALRYAREMKDRKEKLRERFHLLDLDFLWMDIGEENCMDRVVEFFIRRRNLS